VLLWMIERVKGQGKATETPVGFVPTRDALNLEGLSLSNADLETLLAVDRDEWASEVPEIRAFFEKFGDHCPRAMHESLDTLAHQLTAAQV
jgi:phosphoenolpyruvate carboxykinase (GTP)